jgi:hypothetical protein
MKFHKLIEKTIRREGDGSNVAGTVNAVVSGNVGEPGSVSRVSSRRRTRIVQRSGETDVVESESRSEHEGGSA